MYCRVDLSLSNYTELTNYKILSGEHYPDIVRIYERYCEHKEFGGVRPVLLEDITQPNTDLIGYYDSDQLVAFSFILKYPSVNSVITDQFAWDYNNPRLKLGYKSLRSECARYKRLGYDYLYLGDYYAYKAELTGYELGPSLIR